MWLHAYGTVEGCGWPPADGGKLWDSCDHRHTKAGCVCGHLEMEEGWPLVDGGRLQVATYRWRQITGGPRQKTEGCGLWIDIIYAKEIRVYVATCRLRCVTTWRRSRVWMALATYRYRWRQGVDCGWPSAEGYRVCVAICRSRQGVRLKQYVCSHLRGRVWMATCRWRKGGVWPPAERGRVAFCRRRQGMDYEWISAEGGRVIGPVKKCCKK